ncbi:hypothetical protein JCM8097_002375 [Rhodosporidiobolus ruineniae]
MGRSAKLMKRPTKADKETKKILNQSRPRTARLPSPDDDAAPSAIPLFNTSVAGRTQSRPDPRLSSRTADDLADDSMRDDPPPDDVDEQDEPFAGGKKKPKGGLRDKVRRAKDSLKDDQMRTDAKLGRTKAKKGGKVSHVLKGVDYVQLHEKTPGKKRFR